MSRHCYTSLVGVILYVNSNDICKSHRIKSLTKRNNLQFEHPVQYLTFWLLKTHNPLKLTTLVQLSYCSNTLWTVVSAYGYAIDGDDRTWTRWLWLVRGVVASSAVRDIISDPFTVWRVIDVVGYMVVNVSSVRIV